MRRGSGEVVRVARIFPSRHHRIRIADQAHQEGRHRVVVDDAIEGLASDLDEAACLRLRARFYTASVRGATQILERHLATWRRAT